MAFTLEELVPQEASFKLSSTGETEHKLKKFTLRDEAWLETAFGKGTKLHDVLVDRSPLKIAQIAYHQLLDKKAFTNYDAFLEAISTGKDKDALVTAVLDTLGFSQPVLSKLEQERVEALRKAEEEAKAKTAPKPETPNP